MHNFKRACVIISTGALLPACTGFRVLEAQSRVDPQTIALYDLASGTAACPSTYADYTWDEKNQKWVRSVVGSRFRAPGDFHDGALPIRCLKDSPNGKDIYLEALPAPNAKNAKAVARNRLAAILMKHSDDVCTVELGRLTAREAMVNTFGSILTSGLSTASSIVSPDILKSILSGGAAFTNASRTHINAEVYRNVLSTAVAKAIETKRDEQRKALIRHFKDKADVYTADQMVMEVNNYHQTCSFYRGLGLVIEAVSRPTDTESEQLLRSEAALARRQLQLSTAQRTLDAVPKGAAYKSRRDAAQARVDVLQGKYDEAVDSVTAVGNSSTPPPAPAPDEDGNTAANAAASAATNGQ